MYVISASIRLWVEAASLPRGTMYSTDSNTFSVRPPDDFYLARSNVRFWMTLERQIAPPDHWMDIALAGGALRTFYDGVRIYGAQEMLFAAVNVQEWQAKGYYRIEFLDAGVS